MSSIEVKHVEVQHRWEEDVSEKKKTVGSFVPTPLEMSEKEGVASENGRDHGPVTVPDFDFGKPSLQNARMDKKKPSKKKAIIIGCVVVLILAALGSGGNSDKSSSASKENSSERVEHVSKGEEKPSVDKSMLKSSIEAYASLSGDDYTPDTFQALTEALAAAKKVFDDDEATQDDVDSAHSELVSAHSSLKELFKPENYTAVSFADVARNPDDYMGQQLTFTGKVLQVVEGTDETDLRIATDGGWDDVIFVGFDSDLLGGTRVLEDDSVTVYGTCLGQYTYESTLGAAISLPALYADQVVINY